MPGMAPPAPDLPRTAYAGVRRGHGLAALRALVKRWGLYLVLAAAVAGVGAPALAAWSVLPLFWLLATHPAWLAAGVLGYAAVVAALLWAGRHLVWPADWAETERALPLAATQKLAADALGLALLALPLLGLLGAGVAVLVAQGPAWLQPVQAQAVALLGLCVVLGALLVLLGLWRARQAGARGAAVGRRVPARGPATPVLPLHWLLALPGLALWRGAAPRTARVVLAGGLALAALGGAAGRHGTPVWLASFAALTLCVVTAAAALARLELAGLEAGAAALPLAPRALAAARTALALAPALLGLAALLLALPWARVRPAVLPAYVVVSLAAWAWQAHTPLASAEQQGVRWLLLLATTVALASELLA